MFVGCEMTVLSQLQGLFVSRACPKSLWRRLQARPSRSRYGEQGEKGAWCNFSFLLP